MAESIIDKLEQQKIYFTEQAQLLVSASLFFLKVNMKMMNLSVNLH